MTDGKKSSTIELCIRSCDFRRFFVITRISPSLLAADFTLLDRELDRVCSADAIHLDVMDGVFVPNISFGVPVLQAVRKVTKLFFDVHLMIVRPLDYVEAFVKAGADCITFHLESESDPGEVIRKIHSFPDTGERYLSTPLFVTE